MGRFYTEGPNFMLDGKPIQLISGAIHYFRVVPEYWRDRLLKLKACGFNTVETYVAWNIHEPKEGQFNFEGIADIVRFIEIAGELGLHVIVRPSPYICAEWEFGGLPAWLLADSNIRLRCYHKPFLDKVDAYYDVLLPKLKPLLCTNGGPVIAMQIENEYGSYGNDVKYLQHLQNSMIERGIDVLLFTSDGPTDVMIQGGTVPGVLETVNFGSRPEEAFEKLKEYQKDQPLMCMEFWNGWFDHWGEQHHTRDSADVANVLDKMLGAGASVNFYMFHGGTNFGFWNGANCLPKENFEPTITSYDYDVPVGEAGDITDKFHAVREIVGKYVELGELELPPPIKKKGYGRVAFDQKADLFESLNDLSAPIQATCPEPMEKLGQAYGFIMYTTQVSGPRGSHELVLQDVHDRALIFLNGEYKGVIERRKDWTGKIMLEIPAEGATLGILVENMGRTNYGAFLKDYKGITEGVKFGYQFLYHWTIHTLPLDDLKGLTFGALSSGTASPFTTLAAAEEACGPEGCAIDPYAKGEPAFYRATFTVDEPCDTFLSTAGWTKGVVYINGFNIGRYWERGPQKTMYVPGPLLLEGENEIVIFELHGTNEPAVTFLDTPDLG
ncbi:glycoside hydrolase family 35 protein [Paenibacillus contaminans]|uniref:Beta-galactosidase n=1 Tax=Paenibacillus contaminans TaxID=450362 RepID=A0A329MJS8_9BACL|nr:beta-galactosidase family protein [Paenibacillus contaminans]RAV19912.1 beta-galactosidase [Paenibacillus contaminans]